MNNLKRTRQCKKCPWIKGVDAQQIPNGYSVEKHKALKCTIANKDDIAGQLHSIEPLRLWPVMKPTIHIALDG
ncbi:MAG: hypothetical protein HAW67_01345 [Endozoicomonadaceae bacterium]|nr:hypothetical protein [Endozoicomonadaceae bacterium]